MKKPIDQGIKHRLFIRVVDNKKPLILDEKGNRWAETKWIEVKKVNLGSCKKPNRKILGIRFEPIDFEERSRPQKFNLDEFFKGFI